jgi:lipoate-protein ligase A
MTRHRTKVAAGAAALLAIGGAGGAVAALDGSPEDQSDAIVNDAAAELGVSAAELQEALEKALSNRVDEAVEAGRLTEEQGAELKERIAAGEVPLLGGPMFGHHGPGLHHGFFAVGLETAATYLGVSEADLRERLEAGDSLAEVARDHDKSVDGLIDALVTAAEERLNEAVEDGRLTEERRAEILESLRERITDMVNGELGPPPGMRRFEERGPAEMGAAF